MLLLLVACGPQKIEVGGDDTAPTSDTDTPTTPDPDDSGDTTPPDDSGDTTPPDDSGDTTPPDDSGDTTPPDDSGDTTTQPPEDCAVACDDGLDCTADACDGEGRCVYTPLETCDWPTTLPPDVTALASLDSDFAISLSGATWDPVNRALWVVRGNGATAWRIVEDGAGGWEIDHESSLGRIDAESVVVADPEGAPEVLHVMVELDEIVVAYDASGSTARVVETWDTTPWLVASGTNGSEALTFVPDDALEAWGFVDGNGTPRTSALGHGGLFFTGTQNGGDIQVFDLSDTDDTVEHVGTYSTSRTETAGLEFDADTGRLYIWHGGDFNDLEVARLSSTDAGDGTRAFDTEAIFDYPGDDNLEGIALTGLEDCGEDGRPLFLTIDDGGARALDVYTWPLCGP